MSTPTAKDLLAQADRLMRQRTPEELPVLTDLVIEDVEIPGPTERLNEVIPAQARPAWTPNSVKPLAPLSPDSSLGADSPKLPHVAPPQSASASFMAPYSGIASAAPPFAHRSATVDAVDVLGVLPRMTHDTPPGAATAAGPTTVTAMASVREQFNAQLLTRMEELQHSVYSQVMQQLEIYSAGSLKTHLRETLLPALTDIARDIAEQVAEDTATQVRSVVSKAVDSEIARLREQLAKRRF
jgi:hypothetical protein